MLKSTHHNKLLDVEIGLHKNPDGWELECRTHGGIGPYGITEEEATMQADQSAEWCSACESMKPLLDRIKELSGELENQKIKADRFIAHANAIWNAAFPDDRNGWEYGAQLERCVIGKMVELQEERDKYATLYPLVAKVEALEAENRREP